MSLSIEMNASLFEAMKTVDEAVDRGLIYDGRLTGSGNQIVKGLA